MEIPQNKEDIIRMAAKEAGISRLQMEIIAEDLEKGLVFFIRNPLITGLKIFFTAKYQSFLTIKWF